jgi:hypothetical protein
MEEDEMKARSWIVTVLAASGWTLVAALPSLAAPSGVQWTPDSARVLVNKDVGDERWAITLNLADFTATGNVFKSDGSAPSFIWCQKTGDDFDTNAGELNLHYSCYGADRGVGGFASADWTLISDQVAIPMSFFIPEAETCDLTGALNGPNSTQSGNEWNCGGSAGQFQFQVFGNGIATNTATRTFNYDALSEGCRIAKLSDGSYLDLEYSPSRDHLTIYEIPTDTSQVILSECERVDL